MNDVSPLPAAGPPVSPARVMAFDVGDRRIGIALSVSLGSNSGGSQPQQDALSAQPLMTLHRTNRRADLKSVARLLRKHAITIAVVGNPLYMSGDQSPQAAKAQAFADDLRTLAGPAPSPDPTQEASVPYSSEPHPDEWDVNPRPGFPAPTSDVNTHSATPPPTFEVHLWDERLTTTQAHRLLDDAGHARGPNAHGVGRKQIIDQVAAVLILESFLAARQFRLEQERTALPPLSEG